MRIIIAGSRDFDDYIYLRNRCIEIANDLFNDGLIGEYGGMYDVEIVSGGANGADALGEKFAKEFDFDLKIDKANWDDLKENPSFIKNNSSGRPYNALAGKNRNERMAKYASEDNGTLIAFRKNFSSGTTDMINRAKNWKLRTYIFEVK